MKKGPIEDERIYLTLDVVLREYCEVRTDICPVPGEVAQFTGLPLEVVEQHLRELELRRIIVLQCPANESRRRYSLASNAVPFPRPHNTYWLNLYQFNRLMKGSL